MQQANIYYYSRDYDRAIKEFRKAHELHPNFTFTYLYIGFTYSQIDMHEEAIRSMQKVNTLSESPRNVAYLGYVNAVAGNNDKAFQMLDSLLKLSNENLVQHASSMAVLYIGLADNDQALHWLEMAYEHHEYDLNFIKIDPVFDPIRSNPRFIEILKKMGLEK